MYVALDIETTGLDAERDAITEIGAVRFRDDELLDTWSTLVNPQRSIPLGVQRLTGITQQAVQNAPPISAVVPQLARFVGECPVVGHNVGFEFAFLQKHGVLLRNQRLDTFELAHVLLPKVTSYSLSALTQVLGLELKDHHRALSDATASKDLFLALLARGLEMDLGILQEINRTASHSQWPFKQLFQDLERQRSRTAFTSNIREQLLAKGELDDAALGLVLDHKEQLEPLHPAATQVGLDEEELAGMLSPGGLLAQRFPGYEHRPQQIEMLRAVAQAFNEGQQVLAEAGTGTGKSLAYLLPAIYFAVRNGRPVVVSTNTINLQDQLFNKDIPDLQKILPIPFKAALLKGRNNYLCLRRLALFRRSESLQAGEVQVLANILAWLPSTETGDSTELSLRDHEYAIWSQVQAEQETCLGERCPHRRKGRCFLYRARRKAEAAHIVVANHALLLSDMMVANRVLPEYHHLIVDEAHHLEARATEQLGFAVNRGQAHALLASLAQASPSGQFRGFLHSVPQHFHGSSMPAETQKQVGVHVARLETWVEEASRCMQEFFDGLTFFTNDTLASESPKSTSNYDHQFLLTEGVRIQPDWSQVEILAENLYGTLQKVVQGLQTLQAGMSDLEDQGILQYEDLMQELRSRTEHVRQVQQQMRAIINEPESGGIYWLSIRAKDNEITLHSAPLRVAPLLEQNLFPKLETAVFTSATLCTAKEFSYIRERLGLKDAEVLTVDSPFDYHESTLLCLPEDMPEPSQPNYQGAVSRTITKLCLATGGRALILFTSHRQLQTTFYSISRELEEAGIAVTGQGLGGSRRQLLENFRNTPRSVLLGTRSFWEGVDVVGPALSCLVIVHLPFSVPSDPVFAARSRTFDDPFGEYAVPEAVLRFRQGFGRLIRSYHDRGVVVILDKRIQSKSYGVSFLKSLPKCTEYRGGLEGLPAMAARWIDKGQVD
jgi:DNA polymerase-3 subunit epsilon/ATP-dependent DNA helicase DinG